METGGDTVLEKDNPVSVSNPVKYLCIFENS